MPAAVAASVATDFSVGATVGGLNSNFVAVMRQSDGEFVHGFGTPWSAVPPRAGAGWTTFVTAVLSGKTRA